MVRLFISGALVSLVGFYMEAALVCMLGGWLMGLPFSVSLKPSTWYW